MEFESEYSKPELNALKNSGLYDNIKYLFTDSCLKEFSDFVKRGIGEYSDLEVPIRFIIKTEEFADEIMNENSDCFRRAVEIYSSGTGLGYEKSELKMMGLIINIMTNKSETIFSENFFYFLEDELKDFASSVDALMEECSGFSAESIAGALVGEPEYGAS